MKQFVLKTDYVLHYLVVEKSFHDIFIEDITPYFFEFITEDKEPLYSNKNDKYADPKNEKEIFKILGEAIFTDYNFEKLYNDSEMIEIYAFD